MQPSARRVLACNNLLEALPSRDRRCMIDGCEPVQLAFGDVVYVPGEPIEHVHFPTASFISLIMPIDDDACVEVGMVGCEGMFGIPLALGVDVSPVRAVVQGAGPALRMEAPRFCSELARRVTRSTSRTNASLSCWGCAGSVSPRPRVRCRGGA